MNPSELPEAGDPGFAIEFHGLHVQVVIPAPAAGAPSVATILRTLQTSPLKSVDRAAIERALEEATAATGPVRVTVGQVVLPAGAEPPCAIVLSKDRLAAYAAPVLPDLDAPKLPAAPAAPIVPDADDAPDAAPPEVSDSDAPELESAEAASRPEEAAVEAPTLLTDWVLRKLLNEAGVTTGRLNEVIATFEGGAPLLDITCVALGTRPAPGVDAKLEFHFDEPAESAPVLRDDGSVDHHAAVARRFVEEAALLVTRHPPAPGTAGYDVFGKVTEPPPPRDIDLARIAGKNTNVVDNTLLAAAAGRAVHTSSGGVEVLPVFEVGGDVDYSVGNIDFPGDVVVRGDVKSGFTISARGAVTVRGLVEGASITAGRDLALTGVVGERMTLLHVGGNLSASYLHTTEAQVAGAINVVGEIVNCTLTAERVQTSAKGRIVGGEVTARVEIDSGMLGSREGRTTHLCVTSDGPAAVIRGRRGVYSGVVVQVGTARRVITDETEPCSFWNAGGAIVSLRADIDAREAAAATAPAEPDEPPATAA